MKMFVITDTRTKVSVNGILIYFEAFLIRYFQNCFSICPYNSKKKKRKKPYTHIFILNFFSKNMFLISEMRTGFMMSFTNYECEKKKKKH